MSTTLLLRLLSYPVKSCRGSTTSAAVLDQAGLRWDRNWMIVDGTDRFVTQRSHPQLARIDCRIDAGLLTMACPGLPELQIEPARVPALARTVSIWGAAYRALDEGEHVAAWLSECLGGHYRLVRWDDAVARISDRSWTGSDIALNRFSDGFPLLVIGEASLADLNARLPEALPMNRFRPNLVLGGLQAYEEDHIETISAGNVSLRIVKPCTRCEITTTDQRTGARGEEPLRTLATYRSDPRVGGGITFGQNAIITHGIGETLREGMPFEVRWNF